MSAAAGDVHLATTPEAIARCLPVMRELRPFLTDADSFVALIQQQMRERFQLAYLEREGEIVTVAGFRVHHVLVTGLTLYVDDLVTASAHRSEGLGRVMLDWLIAHAREHGCATFSLDSGTHRQDAHAFYLRERMRITSFHFVLNL